MVPRCGSPRPTARWAVHRVRAAAPAWASGRQRLRAVWSVRCGRVDGGLVGDHPDHHIRLGCSARRSGQSGDPHRRPESLVARCDRAGGIRTPLTGAARIIVTDPVPSRRPARARRRRRGQQPPEHRHVSVSSSHAPTVKSRPRIAVWVRRTASGSYRFTRRPPPAQLLFGQGAPLAARSADASSISAQACSPSTSRVAQVTVETIRALNAPFVQRGHPGEPVTQGLAIRIFPDARRTRCDRAPTSAAADAHESNAHNARSSPSSTRRRVNSAIAANWRAPGSPPGPHPVLDRRHQLHITGRRELRFENMWRSTCFRGAFVLLNAGFGWGGGCSGFRGEMRDAHAG